MCTLLLQFKTFPGIRVADPGDAEPDPNIEKKKKLDPDPTLKKQTGAAP